jgi:hypothetical protein
MSGSVDLGGAGPSLLRTLLSSTGKEVSLFSVQVVTYSDET